LGETAFFGPPVLKPADFFYFDLTKMGEKSYTVAKLLEKWTA
jgi:hypothetical protein